MKPQWCDRALFVSPYYFTVCTSEALLHRELRRLKIDRASWPPFLASSHANASAHFFEGLEGKRMAIVCVDAEEAKKHDPVAVVGLLVHEAVHIWQATCDDLGEKTPGAEQEAYAIQHIAQSLISEYSRQTA